VSVEAGAPKDLTSWRLEDDRSKFQPEDVSSEQASGQGAQG